MKRAGKSAVPKTVDEYLDQVPEPARTSLRKVRAAIQSAVPQDATEKISYRMPMFLHKGMVMGFAAFSDHCSLFPGHLSAFTAFEDELAAFETAAGTIRFPVDKPPSAALVKKLVRARIAENEKAENKRKVGLKKAKKAGTQA
jgi:uncharacterized protein YdhG (YjbR/CyaY superfamily)